MGATNRSPIFRSSPLRGSGGVVGTLQGAQGAVSQTFGALPTPQCIFDGYALSHKIHLEGAGTNSTLTVWAQDVSWRMNLTEKVREWVNVTDAAVANQIFSDYSIIPSDQNAADVSPSHTELGHSLMQRGSDIQFLRSLARRNGKVCRIACDDKPGMRTGYFATPRLDGNPVVTLTLTDVQNWTVSAVDLEWDATRPTAVVARQALFSDPERERRVRRYVEFGVAGPGRPDSRSLHHPGDDRAPGGAGR